MDEPCSGCPKTATVPDTIEKVHGFILDDCFKSQMTVWTEF